MELHRLMSVAILTVAMAASPCFAGVLVEERTEQLDGGGTPHTSQIRVDSDRVRVETWSGDRPNILIYRADRETMYMIDPNDKTYREITKQDLERMMGQVSDQMSQMQKRMEEQLKNLPPERREMVERMMKQRMGAMGGAGAAPSQQSRTVYQKVASGETVNQWTCDKYEGTREGQKQMDVWTTGWQEFGLTQDDFQVFRDLAAFFRSLNPSMSDDLFQVGSAEAESEQMFSGVPVRRISYRNGSPLHRMDVTRVERQDFEDSLFEPPDGYQKQTMPALRGAPQ